MYFFGSRPETRIEQCGLPKKNDPHIIARFGDRSGGHKDRSAGEQDRRGQEEDSREVQE